MKVGFDYWQVLSHYPNQLREIWSSLANNANDVYVISAVGKERAGTVAPALRKIWNWPTMPDWLIHEVIFEHPRESPELKLAKCQELGIEVFFDDRDDVCRLLNKNGILGLRVTRKDNSTYDLGAEIK